MQINQMHPFGMIALAFVLNVSSAVPASACDCLEAFVQWPDDGAVVPPDVRFIWGSSLAPPDVTDDAGSVVDVTWEQVGSSFWTVAPSSPLAPGTYGWRDRSGQDLAFAVDDEVDIPLASPPTVEVDRTQWFSGALSPCGESFSAAFDATHNGVVEVMVLDRDVTDANAMVWSSAQPSGGFVGRGPCLGLWDGTVDDDTVFRVGAFDEAGRFTGWSEPVTATRPNRLLCTSMHDMSAEAPSLSLALLLLLGAGRLRRRQRGC